MPRKSVTVVDSDGAYRPGSTDGDPLAEWADESRPLTSGSNDGDKRSILSDDETNPSERPRTSESVGDSATEDDEPRPDSVQTAPTDELATPTDDMGRVQKPWTLRRPRPVGTRKEQLMAARDKRKREPLWKQRRAKPIHILRPYREDQVVMQPDGTFSILCESVYVCV
jgi:hypothetical protein